MRARIFIDGQAGTTGLEIAARLRCREDLELLTIPDAERKDPTARAACFDQADVAILCLPDAAAREAAILAQGRCRLIDASSAHRTEANWVYGLPELAPEQPGRIAEAARVANPGCYPTGFILCVRPLIRAGLLPADSALSVHALSGYSGGGKAMIESYQSASTAQIESWGTRPYALGLRHKHIPEMAYHAGLKRQPLFTPMVGAFYKGMITQTPLFTDQLSHGAGRAEVVATLGAAYADSDFVRIVEADDLPGLEGGLLCPSARNDSNRLDICVFGQGDTLLLTARYDNLGKGASGAAVQNLNLMLGVEQDRSLAA